MRRYFSLIISCLAFCEALNAQTQLTEYLPGVTSEGAVYFLPKTAFRITMQIEKTTYKPGDFAPYAQRFMRLKDISQEPSTQYRIINFQLVPFAVPDSTKKYAIKFNAKTVASNVALSEDGRLLAINAEPNAVKEPKPFVSYTKKKRANPRQFLTQEILSAGSTAKMAELTAQEIYDLRENRNLLIKGQADFMPKDGEQLRLMLQQIDTQDEALTSMFKGTYDCDTTEHSLTVCPDGSFNRQLLFRLSQVYGLVDTDDLSGAPYYISVEDMQYVPTAIDEKAAAKAKKKAYEAGVYVNIPGRMRVTLYQGIDAVLNAELPAAQFGNVELLSGELFNKHYTTHLWLNPLTGGVERLEAEQPK